MRIVNVIISIIFLVLIGFGLFWLYNYFYGPERDVVVVPDLTGMDVKEATASLKLIGLELQVVSYTFSDKPSDVIVKQYPSGGSQVSKGAIVKVVLSSGKKVENIPNVLNQKLNEALVILNSFSSKYNLALKVIYYPTLWFDEGKILMQYPVVYLPSDKNIDLLVAKKVNVNDILSKKYSTIKDFLYDVNVDALFLEALNVQENEDRIITNVEFYNNTVVAQSTLNYSQLPTMKITNIHLKAVYSEDINLLEVFLRDYLGERIIVKQYYVGVFSTTLQLVYFGEGNVVIKVNGKRTSSYTLP